jgi:hypothetical protein
MLLALALSALSLAPQSPQTLDQPRKPVVVLAGLPAPAAPAPSSLAERIAEARRRAAPPSVAVPDLREQRRIAAMFPERPADGLGSATRRAVLGLRPSGKVKTDERLGASGRRSALSNPPLPQRRARR